MTRLKVGEVIAVDGKTLRRSYDRRHGQRAIEMMAHEAPRKYKAVKHERWVERTKAHGRIETRRYVLVTYAD